MNKLSKVSVAVATLLTATAVSAASFDVRHEYKHDSKEHATRVKLADSIGNFLVDIEAKLKDRKDGDFLQNLENNGWELGLNYRHVINDNWTMTYGMPIEGRDSGVTYKPQVRATYSLDSVEGLSLSARYRYDMRQNSSYMAENDQGELVKVNPDNQRRHRITGNVNYAINDLRFGFEANWFKADGYDIFDNGDTNYELNATARKIMGQWAPYVEFGDVNVNATTDKRELRSRVGLTYSF
ncbi:oligogalacturonate-specific porin KdgM family protein [Vibrio sp. WXL103]|uniref:oligogalacturonate-specific porin KdgM family protein n=1 Tax=Vibrio sp. WXL103 TaxID=3450710 RepID=UPI003EC8B295